MYVLAVCEGMKVHVCLCVCVVGTQDLGDVEYIAQTLEADMQHITTSLEFITRPAT